MQPGKGAPCPPRSTLSCPAPTAALTLPLTQGGRACPPRAPTEPCSWPLVAPGQLPLVDKWPRVVGGGLDPGKGLGPLRAAAARGLAGAAALSRRRVGAGWRSVSTGHFRGKKQVRGAGGSPPARPRHHSGRAACCSPPYINSQPPHLPGLSPSHPRHRSLPTRRWTMFKWTRRRPRPCRTPCRSGQTCGSPRSPPRVPSCDGPRPGRGPEAPSAEPASGLLALRLCSVPACPPPLSATLAFKALGIRDPDPFPLGGEGLIEALPPPSPGPPLIFISNGHPTLVRALAKKHPQASACPSDPNIYRKCGGGAAALSRFRTSPSGLQLLGSPPRPRKRPHRPADQAAKEQQASVDTDLFVPASLGRGGARPPKGGGAAEEGQRRS